MSRRWRRWTPLVLVAVLLAPGSAAVAASASQRTVLLKKGLMGPYGEGWGKSHPAHVSNGGDANGYVSHVKWAGWGHHVAKGTGLGNAFKPQGGYYAKHVKVNFRATRIRQCTADGPRRYTRLHARMQKKPGGSWGKWFVWARMTCGQSADTSSMMTSPAGSSVQTGPAALVSYASNGEQGDSWSWAGRIVANGTQAVFLSEATNLDGGNTKPGIYSRDLVSGQTQRVDVDADGHALGRAGQYPVVSDDGRFIPFLPGGRQSCTKDGHSAPVYVRDLEVGTTTDVSATTPCAGVPNNPAISADGRYVVWTDDGTIWEYDSTTQTATALVSELGQIIDLSMSADASTISFASGDDWQWQILDVATQTLTALTKPSGGPIEMHGDSNCATPEMLSGDGRYFLFFTNQSGVVPGDLNGNTDAFVYDRKSGDYTRETVTAAGAPAYGCGTAISRSGRYVLFESNDSGLNSDGATGTFSYLRDRSTGDVDRVTRGSDSTTAVGGSDVNATFSPDGSQVSFESWSDKIVLGDLNSQGDIFVAPLTSALAAPSIAVGDGALSARWSATSASNRDVYGRTARAAAPRLSGKVMVRYLPGDEAPSTRSQGKLAYTGTGTHVTIGKLADGQHYSFAIFRLAATGKVVTRQVLTAAPVHAIATKAKLVASHSSVKKGSKVALTATLKKANGKAVVGQLLRLYQRGSNRKPWRYLAQARTNAVGEVTYTRTITAPRQFQVRHLATPYFAASRAEISVAVHSARAGEFQPGTE